MALARFDRAILSLAILTLWLAIPAHLPARDAPAPPYSMTVPKDWSLARAAYRCGRPYWVYAPGTPADHLKLERKAKEREAYFRKTSLQIARGYCSKRRGPKFQADYLVRMGQLRKIHIKSTDPKAKCVSHWVPSLLPFEAAEMSAVYQEHPSDEGQLKTFTHFFTFDNRTLWKIQYEGTGARYDTHIDKVVQALQTLKFPNHLTKRR